MSLDLLRIKNLRNIEEIELEPDSGINLICGDNGSGKTSILEAIYLLGRGRSFRSEHVRPIVREGRDALEVFGRVAEKEGIFKAIGIRKGKSGAEVRMDGANVKKLSQLARVFPLLIVTPKSHEIIERGPDYRRRFLDWGVFHVEHDFHSSVIKYRRALRQRNAALKMAPKEVSAWDSTLVDSGLMVNRYRRDFIQRLEPLFCQTVAIFLGHQEVALQYKQDQRDQEQYLDNLRKQRKEEERRGYTLVGPHRSDMGILFRGKPAAQLASRGEQKLIIGALYIALARLIAESEREKLVLLIDDLPAELDRKNRRLFMDQLLDTGFQVFITGTEESLFEDICQYKRFHVEHGKLRDAL